jgi:hypothetical protein
MGTTLTGTTPQDTYDSLIKVTDNGPIGATPKYLSDGLGTDSSLALSTKNILIGTTTAVVNYGRELVVDATALTSEPEAFLALKGNRVSGNIAAVPFYNGAEQVGSITMQAEGNMRLLTGTTTANTSEKVRITSAGQVAIGTSSPASFSDGFVSLQVKNAANNISANGGSYLEITQNANFDSGWKYVGSAAASRYEQGVGGHYFFTAPSGTAGNAVTFSERVRIDSDGLKFNGDTAAANALDDYEEGTWTATLTDGTVSKTSTAEYTKIGRQVFIRGGISNAEDPSSFTGDVYITGVPFVPTASTSMYGFNNYMSTATIFVPYLESNQVIRFYKVGAANADNTQIQGSDLEFYTDIYFAGTFTV